MFIPFLDEEYPVFPKDYELVARVDTHDLDEAYGLTNHIDTAWWENEKVTLFKESRSSSVGDVLRYLGDPIEHSFMVDMVGFTEARMK